MNNKMFASENIVSSLAFIALFGGISTCGFYYNSPEIVKIASFVALAGWFADKGMAFVARSSQSKLSFAEATELLFLRQLRAKVKNSEVVSEELLSVSERASSDSDKEYQNVYGFGRPLPVTAFKQS
jgi:hypothetical protein